MTTGSSLLRLADGVHVVRRGRDRLQVGLDPERRVVLPRDAATSALLDRLAGDGTGGDGPGDRHVLDQLRRRDLVTPVDPRPPVRVVVHRAGARGSWPVEPAALLGVTDDRSLLLVRSDADAVLVLSRGEPDRDELDPLVRDGVPHLVVTLGDGGARLGPLVVPGRTACLRCLDAHHAATDPEHLSVLLRYADAVAGAAAVAPDLPEPGDPALAAVVTAWALRDLARLGADGPDGPDDRTATTSPATWSSTLHWHPGAAGPVTRRWLRQPGCGCGWASTHWDG